MIIAAPSLRGVKDQFRRFEYQLPFYQTEIDSFFQYVALASMDTDGKSVTLEGMRAFLKGAEWAELDDDESPLAKLLLSEAFRRSGTPAGAIDRQALSLFAIMHCHGKVHQRSEHLLHLVQDRRASTLSPTKRNMPISASTKNMEEIFGTICGLSSFDIFPAHAEAGELYSEDEI